jgi:hypothetical protein
MTTGLGGQAAGPGPRGLGVDQTVDGREVCRSEGGEHGASPGSGRPEAVGGLAGNDTDVAPVGRLAVSEVDDQLQARVGRGKAASTTNSTTVRPMRVTRTT